MAAWIEDVGHRGLSEVRKIPGYNDEALKGKRNGQRSIRLNKAYRAIYIVDHTGVVSFVEITKQHLCDIEHERKSVSPKLAATYAKILGYSVQQFIRLALQDLVDREGLNVQVEITQKKRVKQASSKKAA